MFTKIVFVEKDVGRADLKVHEEASPPSDAQIDAARATFEPGASYPGPHRFALNVECEMVATVLGGSGTIERKESREAPSSTCTELKFGDTVRIPCNTPYAWHAHPKVKMVIQMVCAPPWSPRQCLTLPRS